MTEVTKLQPATNLPPFDVDADAAFAFCPSCRRLAAAPR